MLEVVEGYCAVKTGNHWIGLIQGNKFCRSKRKTAKKALKDAEKFLKDTPDLPQSLSFNLASEQREEPSI